MMQPGDEDEILATGGSQEGAWEAEAQLALADDDEALPWLEADDYEDDGGFDWRLIWLALFGLVIIVAILAAAWWFTREQDAPELAADGSTIAAPEGAYKQRPDDPGGAEVAGTGDQAFEVAEGESTRGIIASDDGGASGTAPSIDLEQSGSAATVPSADVVADAAYVQIGAYGSRADADTAWNTAASRYSVLSGMRHRVIEAEVNGATVFRLQAIASDRAAAEATCRAIRGAGGDCYVR